MNELNRDEYFYNGRYYPSQIERLQNAYGKSFSTLDELRQFNAPVNMSFLNYYLGQVNQKPPVETNKSFYDPLYMTVSGIPSNLIEGQARTNDRILGLGEYVRKNEHLQQFYPSIRIAK
jgi:hypothetical protein